MMGKLYGVGVGPGDPELITLKAKNILESVDVIAVPITSKDKESVALKIASRFICEKSSIIELEFPMSQDSKVLSDSWEKASDIVSEKLEKGFNVAFITLGDPTVYSTYIYLHKIIIKKGFAAEIVPGVTSFCASAAKAGISLAEGRESFAIIPSVYENDKLSEIFDSFDNVVLMKASRSITDLKTLLKDKDLIKNTVVVSNCGMDGEYIEYGSRNEDSEKLGYFTTVIIKKGGVR